MLSSKLDTLEGLELLKSSISFVMKCLVQENNNVQQHARVCLALIAQCNFTAETVREILSLMETIVASSLDWHIRRAVLPFAQLLDFNHRFVCGPELHLLTHELCVKLLADPQIEVRELAAITLNSVLRGSDPAYLGQLAQRFQKAARIQLGEGKGIDLKSKRFGVKHGGVLGLGALLLLYPYDLPAFVVPWLMELVSHIDGPSTIASSVNNTVKDFRRTHQEMWHIYSTQVLSPDQSRILQELLVSPTYYA